RGTPSGRRLQPSPHARPPQPVKEYLIKAGDWDGLIDLKFYISVDAKKRPTQIREESADFYKLPASGIVIEAGQRMHRYYGLTLASTQVAEVVRRAIRRDHFDDLFNKVGEDTYYDHKEGDDNWEKLA